MPNWMWSGLVMLTELDALGRSTLTAWVRNGAVTMKITSSTSMTSIIGTMFMSDIGLWYPRLLKLPIAI